ncbi:MAG: hypothetical protein HYW26_01230 [Candidatus Aenigmarchaeota archaeon]|nr:hypothetical protein [Candidatus Aenigmarchaeota archaeon]
MAKRGIRFTHDLGRVGSALGILGGGGYWFANQQAPVRNGFANSVAEPFGLYGAFEGWGVYNDFKRNRHEGENFPRYLWRLAREDRWKLVDYAGKVAPLASPFIGATTNNDFTSTILVPFAAHLVGYGVDYLRKAKKTPANLGNPK